MRIESTCDFCGKSGNWEAGLFDKQSDVKDRPKDWAAIFPANVKHMPKGSTFSPESLKQHRVETACACPDCARADGQVVPNEPPKLHA